MYIHLHSRAGIVSEMCRYRWLGWVFCIHPFIRFGGRPLPSCQRKSYAHARGRFPNGWATPSLDESRLQLSNISSSIKPGRRPFIRWLGLSAFNMAPSLFRTRYTAAHDDIKRQMIATPLPMAGTMVKTKTIRWPCMGGICVCFICLSGHCNPLPH